VFPAFIYLEVLADRHAVGAADGERVQSGLSPHGPSCLPRDLGVHAPGDQVQGLQSGLLGGKVAAGPDGAAVAGFERANHVRRLNALGYKAPCNPSPNQPGPCQPRTVKVTFIFELGALCNTLTSLRGQPNHG
jgi:hypothetical protein